MVKQANAHLGGHREEQKARGLEREGQGGEERSGERKRTTETDHRETQGWEGVKKSSGREERREQPDGLMAEPPPGQKQGLLEGPSQKGQEGSREVGALAAC